MSVDEEGEGGGELQRGSQLTKGKRRKVRESARKLKQFWEVLEKALK